MKSLILCFDGTSRPNPGKCACSYVISDNTQVIEKSGIYIGEGTNNIAEYLGLILGLIACTKYTPEGLIVYTDSNLVIHQIKGDYRVRDGELKKIAHRRTGTDETIQKKLILSMYPTKKIGHILWRRNILKKVFLIDKPAS